MNQTEATAKMASVIRDGIRSDRERTGWEGTVNVGTPVGRDGPDVLLVSFLNGVRLSVTVEILAQP